MPVKKYCENSQKAEIFLSLPNGKERLITSLAPPVTITTGYTARRYRQWYIRYRNISGDQEYIYTKPVDLFLYESDEFEDGITNHNGVINYRHNEVVWSVERNYKGYNPDPAFEVIKTITFPVNHDDGYDHSIRNSLDHLDFYPRYIEIENCFIIEDTESILYYAEETGKEAVRVDCVDCPDDLCGIRGRTDIVCLDCELVINQLGRIDSAVLELLE